MIGLLEDMFDAIAVDPVGKNPDKKDCSNEHYPLDKQFIEIEISFPHLKNGDGLSPERLYIERYARIETIIREYIEMGKKMDEMLAEHQAIRGMKKKDKVVDEIIKIREKMILIENYFKDLNIIK